VYIPTFLLLPWQELHLGLVASFYGIEVSVDQRREGEGMSNYGGFIYRLENTKDAEEIRKRIKEIGFFADALGLGDMRPEIPEVSLIALGEGEAFTHAALMTPKKEAGSIRHMMAFSNCVALPTIAFTDIPTKMGREVWLKVTRQLTYNGRSERLSPELMRGIYLPLDFWPVLLASPQVQVSEEGRRISYNNCRYLNNTLFSELAQYGWIGSSQPYTDRLTDELAKIIQITLDAKKSAMIGEIRE
jgi:hypothetical protein